MNIVPENAYGPILSSPVHYRIHEVGQLRNLSPSKAVTADSGARVLGNNAFMDTAPVLYNVEERRRVIGMTHLPGHYRTGAQCVNSRTSSQRMPTVLFVVTCNSMFLGVGE